LLLFREVHFFTPSWFGLTRPDLLTGAVKPRGEETG
jgi:hypothetical protein